MSERIVNFMVLAVWVFTIQFRLQSAEQNPGDCLWTFKAPEGRIAYTGVYAITGKDRVFWVPRDPTHDLQSFAYAIDMKSGEVLWETDLGDVFCNEPALSGNRLIVSTHDRLQQESTTFCLDATNGKILWQRKHGAWQIDNYGWPNRPVICGDYVMVMGQLHTPGLPQPGNAKLICLDLKDGYPVWSANEAMTGRFTSMTDAVKGRVYFGMTNLWPTGGNNRTDICSFTPSTGQLKHEFDLPDPMLDLHPLGPVIADGMLYAKTRMGTLHCFDLATKSLEWTVQTDQLSKQPVASGGIVVVPLGTGEVVGLRSKDGKELWRRFVDKILDEAIIHNGQVIVPARQNATALRLDDGSKLWQYFITKPVLGGRPCAEAETVLIPVAHMYERISLYALKIAAKLPPR